MRKAPQTMLLLLLPLLGSVSALPGLAAGLPEARERQEAAESADALVGIVAGLISLPPEADLATPAQVLLLTPEWAASWNSQLQQRVDGYWFQYLDALAEDPSLFEELSARAHREAAVAIIQRMEVRLGERFADYLREASPEGRFEFTAVPYGDYQVMAFARVRDRGLIWIESFSVTGPLPIFVELRRRIQ